MSDHPTSISQVPDASDATLRRTLLTCDGAGAKVKEAALNELMRRQDDTRLINWLQFAPNPRLTQLQDAWAKNLGGVSLRATLRYLSRS